eukprot:TRINITY_DN826_c0_g2_i3.p1 TRINITY_DN826_c0_g2~~TRINITY_DN826_c0_g2_i3.p1  ORF type:complete len:479 (+),score=78.95 TRINITY_DN826_c0_g2_i3:1461-2897(+)
MINLFLDSNYYTGFPEKLSEDQILTCTDAFTDTNDSCSGGLPQDALEYAAQLYNDVGASIQTYTEFASSQNCDKPSTSKLAYDPVIAWEESPANDPMELLKVVANQPAVVGISTRGGLRYWTTTSDEIYNGTYGTYSCSLDSVDHNLLIVGYGVRTVKGVRVPYWLARNSWGSTWGTNGYIKIVRSTVLGAGVCNMLSVPPVYPIVKIFPLTSLPTTPPPPGRRKLLATDRVMPSMSMETGGAFGMPGQETIALTVQGQGQGQGQNIQPKEAAEGQRASDAVRATHMSEWADASATSDAESANSASASASAALPVGRAFLTVVQAGRAGVQVADLAAVTAYFKGSVLTVRVDTVAALPSESTFGNALPIDTQAMEGRQLTLLLLGVDDDSSRVNAETANSHLSAIDWCNADTAGAAVQMELSLLAGLNVNVPLDADADAALDVAGITMTVKLACSDWTSEDGVAARMLVFGGGVASKN